MWEFRRVTVIPGGVPYLDGTIFEKIEKRLREEAVGRGQSSSM